MQKKDKKNFAIITGASGDIGRVLVEKFQKSGYFVIAVDKEPPPKQSKLSIYIKIDLDKFVTNKNSQNLFFFKIKKIIGKNNLKVLINNAAIQVLGNTDSLNYNDWKKTINVNLLAPFFLTQGLTKLLVASKGNVINISSIHSRLTKKNFTAYATSKAALSALTRSMAIDFGPKIRVNSIEPAAIETKMLKDGFNNPNMIKKLKSYHPIAQLGQPEDIAALSLFLSGDGAKFMHGENISLSGGISSKLFDPN